MTDHVATPDATEPALQMTGEALRDEDIVADPNAGGSRLLVTLAAALLTLGSLFGPISASGIWEPHELKVADLARRIAVALLGAKQLVIEGATNTVPSSGELGRGELPFTSIALGLKLFGLSEWAGRLPMALWGLAGALATYLLVARLVDRVAAAFAAIVLATSPLYFLQARTILGDIVTMSGLAIAVAGLALAVFDSRPSPGGRVGYFLLGAAGMAAGYGARGILIGIAVPSVAIGVAWLVRGPRATDKLSGVFATLSLLLGAAALAIGLRALLKAEDHQFVRLLGCTVDRKRTLPTHDALVLELGHSLFPWSAVVPFALGRMLRAPVGVSGEAFERETSARVVVLVVSVVAFGMYTALAPAVGVLPFSAVPALAVAAALAFRDLERGAPGSRSLALGVGALLVLFYTDFKNFPEKGLAPFLIEDAKFPESFKDTGLKIVELGSLACAALFALFVFEREEGRPVFDREEHRVWPRTLRATADGNVLFAVVALEVALVVLAVVTVVSEHGVHIRQLDEMVGPARQLAKVGFVLLPVLVAAPHAVILARDVCRVALRRVHVTRASAALLSVAAFGATLSFGYYPLLARQMSPKEVFESFQRLSRPGEELAMIGTGSGTGSARYYAHRDVRTFTGSQEAFTWLTEHDEQRRWLVVRASDIGQMNMQFRGRHLPSHNLPVLDARSSEILLVSNVLRSGETNQNPFQSWILDARPSAQHPLDVDFNGQLHAIGWDLTTVDGQPVTSVRAGKPYVLRLYYEVTRPISGEWQTFVHIDGYQRRYNGDHDTLEGKYAFHLWRPGDYVADIHQIELEPNFTAGTYTMYFGLFRGEQRLEVKRGGSEDNRVNAGPIEVR
jgi:4-amino-4-deoxy-L-arabinose transferase-like glycosyltransferase